MTEETRLKISEAHKGKPSGHKGHHHSEESKHKISEANKKSCKGQRNHCVPHSEETKKKIANSVHLASLEKHQLLIKNA